MDALGASFCTTGASSTLCVHSTQWFTVGKQHGCSSPSPPPPPPSVLIAPACHAPNQQCLCVIYRARRSRQKRLRCQGRRHTAHGFLEAFGGTCPQGRVIIMSQSLTTVRPAGPAHLVEQHLASQFQLLLQLLLQPPLQLPLQLLLQPPFQVQSARMCRAQVRLRARYATAAYAGSSSGAARVRPGSPTNPRGRHACGSATCPTGAPRVCRTCSTCTA